MRWSDNRKLEFCLKYDEIRGCWKARVQMSNKHGFTKRFKTCKQANDWYARYKEEYCRTRGINQ